MKRLSVILQWLAVGGLVLFVASLFLRTAAVGPTTTSDTWSQWQGFVAISYGAATTDGRGASIGRETLRSHLKALHQAGYQTVSSRDVAEFLAGNAAMPRKALYLFFESSSKETVYAAEPILTDVGFQASLYVPTKSLHSWNQFRLSGRDLRAIAENPHWDVNSLGHAALDPIAVDAAGTPGFFLADLAWRPDRTRREALDEFRARVADDYEVSFREISRTSGVAPFGYCAFPANTLGASAPSEIAAANLAALRKRFRFAFTREGETFNPRSADPFGLTRIRVDTGWTADRLLEELDAAWPRTSRYRAADDSLAGAWRSKLGRLERADTALRIVPSESGEGFAWLRGTGLWRDAALHVALVPSRATHLVYLRYRDPGSYVRLAVDENEIRLQERLGSRLQTLFAKPLAFSPGETQRFDILVKRNRVSIRLNGEPIGDGVFPIGATTATGTIGLGVLSGEPKDAAVFREVEAYRLRPRWLATGEEGPLPDATTAELTQLIVPAPTEGAGLSKERAAALFGSAVVGVETFLMDDLERSSISVDSELRRLTSLVRDPRLFSLVPGVVLRFSSPASTDIAQALTQTLQAEGVPVAWLVSGSVMRSWVAEKRRPTADRILVGETRSDDASIAPFFRWFPASRTFFSERVTPFGKVYS